MATQAVGLAAAADYRSVVGISTPPRLLDASVAAPPPAHWRRLLVTVDGAGAGRAAPLQS